jgi:type I site-specific restriction endonuclease
MDKKALSESDICDRFITLAVEKAGWRLVGVRRGC